jgi:hypothetical protein
MAVNQEKSEVIKTLKETQNSANKQAMLNTENFSKFFGPKLDGLTQSINSASSSSSFLSRIIIIVTVVGTLIAAFQWYSDYSKTPNFSGLSNDNLACIMRLAKDQNDQVTSIAFEICSRKKMQNTK